VELQNVHVSMVESYTVHGGNTFLILRSTGRPHMSPVVKLPLLVCHLLQLVSGPLPYRLWLAAWVPITPLIPDRAKK
jgi:hypothetical protein